MSNLRIIDYNAANIATISTSTTAGTLVAANMLTDIKSQVWRSTGTSAAITATWTAGQSIDSVILPYSNLTKDATMRVRGYANSTDVVGVATPLFDSTLYCCPYTSASIFGWDTNIPGVDNFGYGGAVYASAFIGAEALIKKIYIEISDTTNSSGYIEVGRIVIGNYWEPTYNSDYGLSLNYEDRSSHNRNDGGDLMTDIQTRSKTITFSLSQFNASDREKLMKIYRSNGTSTPVYISFFPEDTDKNLEQDYQIYGKFDNLPPMALQWIDRYSVSLTIKEI